MKKTRSYAPLIITGMHASGLERCADLLERCGLDLEENENFTKLHDEFLRVQGIAEMGLVTKKALKVAPKLDEKAAQLVEACDTDKPWGFVEPRAVLFLDFWASLIPEAQFLFIYRSPWQNLDAVFMMENSVSANNPGHAADVWCAYNRRILEFQAKTDRSLVADAQYLLDAPGKLVDAIGDKFSLSLSFNDRESDDESEQSDRDWSDKIDIITKLYPESLSVLKDLEKVSLTIEGRQKQRTDSSHSSPTDEERLLAWFHATRNESDVHNLQKRSAEALTLVAELTTKLEAAEEELSRLRSELALRQLEVDRSRWRRKIAGEEPQADYAPDDTRVAALERELEKTRAQLDLAQFDLQRSRTRQVELQNHLAQHMEV